MGGEGKERERVLETKGIEERSKKNYTRPIATHCNILQHIITYCNTLHHSETDLEKCLAIKRHAATPCSILQHTAAHCNTQHTAAH